jgi:hypothetical protein
LVTSRIPSDHIIASFRQLELQHDSAVVPDWLNAAKGTESCERVVRLIELLREAEFGYEKLIRERWHMLQPGKPRSKVAREQLADLGHKLATIDEMLLRYSYSPRIRRAMLERTWVLSMSSAHSADEFVFERVVHVEEERSKEGVTYFARACEHTIREGDVALRILNLAATSELERVKQCETCSRWFYAERSHQKFCPGGECRIAKYSKTPKFKTYRKNYMRQLRAKQAKEKSTKLLKRKGK